MLAEIAENWCSDNFSPHGAALIADVVSVARPCIGYGLAVALVRRATEHGQGLLATAPMPLGLTAIVGPVLDALLIIPAGAIMAPGVAMSSIRIDLTVSISGMAVGDLLGIMVITPPLLWLMGGAKVGWRLRPALRWADGRQVGRQMGRLVQNAVLIGGCLWLTVALWRAGLGLQPVPMLLAGAGWGCAMAGWRPGLPFWPKWRCFCRLGADADRCPAAGTASGAGGGGAGYLAGGQLCRCAGRRAPGAGPPQPPAVPGRAAENTARHVGGGDPRNQPAAEHAGDEANHLRTATASLPAEICGDIPQSAELVDRKARALADLVRRLRRFGGREVDAPSALPVDMLIDMAQRIVLPELRRAGARLEVGVVPPDLVVQAQEIELTQALVNLLRNAISAAPDALVRLEAGRAGEQARITLRNTFVRERQGAGQGMGVGLIIARTIVEAHGGTLMQEENGQEMVVTLMLPLAGGL
jgi:hypothetical protein